MARMIYGSVLAVSVLISGQAMALEGNAEDGAKVFKKCAVCHIVEEAKNKVGPTLNGVIGRVPGSLADYRYSKAMTEFGDGKVWDDALLTTYLADPKGVVKGTKMAFAGLKKEQDVADVIAYIKQFSPAAN
ncbi:MAG: cytochrome c family protein [Nitratireductor sp.]|nr:cytochrome c family protein [Nitratireductor sp.]